MAERKSKGVAKAPVNEIVRLIQLANTHGQKKGKTTITVKKDAGTVSLTVEGSIATDSGSLINAIAVNGGAKFGAKLVNGFGQATHSGTETLDASGGRIIALEMINGQRAKEQDESEAETDTDLEPKDAASAVTA